MPVQLATLGPQVQYANRHLVSAMFFFISIYFINNMKKKELWNFQLHRWIWYSHLFVFRLQITSKACTSKSLHLKTQSHSLDNFGWRENPLKHKVNATSVILCIVGYHCPTHYANIHLSVVKRSIQAQVSDDGSFESWEIYFGDKMLMLSSHEYIYVSQSGR